MENQTMAEQRFESILKRIASGEAIVYPGIIPNTMFGDEMRALKTVAQLVLEGQEPDFAISAVKRASAVIVSAQMKQLQTRKTKRNRPQD